MVPNEKGLSLMRVPESAVYIKVNATHSTRIRIIHPILLGSAI